MAVVFFNDLLDEERGRRALEPKEVCDVDVALRGAEVLELDPGVGAFAGLIDGVGAFGEVWKGLAGFGQTLSKGAA